MNRFIEVISEDRRYRKERYPAVVLEDPTNNAFINGLEYRAGVDGREDFLSKEEIMKKKEVAPKTRAEKFPAEAVIGSDDIIGIFHGQKLNITPKPGKEGSKYPGDYVNPREYALYMFYTVLPNIARTKDDYNKDKHHFYLLDREYEASVRNESRKKRFQAQEFLMKDVTLERQKKLAWLINFKSKKFTFGNIAQLTSSALEDKLHEVAEKDPDALLACDVNKYPDVGVEMFIVDAITHGVLKLKGVDYYDQERYVGSDLISIRKHLESDENIVLKWKAKMK